MSQRRHHLRISPFQRLLRGHPVFSVFAAVVAMIGAASVVTGAVGGLAASRRVTVLAPEPVITDRPAGEPWSDPPPAPPASQSADIDTGPGTDAGRPAGAPPTVTRRTAPATSGDGRRTAPAAACGVTDKLVPTCGRLWGVAPGAYTGQRPSRALASFEETTGRPADILHVYHRGDDLFPTRDEQAAAVQNGQRRLILANWKVAWGTTWADVARGGRDDRIDRLAGYLRAHYTDRFYLAIHHEPENDVSTDPASGMTARDYAAMFRHTVRRLRAAGVTNAVTVLVYMAYEHWCVQPWFADLWPGDDVVDWVGFDPYLFARPGGYGHGDFGYLVDRTSDPRRWPGFYTWVTRTHGDKPVMIAEWGVFEYPTDPSKKAWIYSTVADQLARYPAIRALVYFDSPAAPRGDTRPDSSGVALAEYRRLAGSTLFPVEVG